jgi:hypothetical protein
VVAHVLLYRSPVGVFWIRPQPNSEERFWLGIGDERLGSYDSARAAVDDVYTQHTGWHAWDSLRDANAPTDLSEWERGRADL